MRNVGHGPPHKRETWQSGKALVFEDNQGHNVSMHTSMPTCLQGMSLYDDIIFLPRKPDSFEPCSVFIGGLGSTAAVGLGLLPLKAASSIFSGRLCCPLNIIDS